MSGFSSLFYLCQYIFLVVMKIKNRQVYRRRTTVLRSELRIFVIMLQFIIEFKYNTYLLYCSNLYQWPVGTYENYAWRHIAEWFSHIYIYTFNIIIKWYLYYNIMYTHRRHTTQKSSYIGLSFCWELKYYNDM